MYQNSRIYYGGDNGVSLARRNGDRILHCAKYPWHVRMAGNKLSKDNTNYMYVEKDNEAALNLVDNDTYNPEYQQLFNDAILKAFKFLDKHQGAVYIHCNQGGSRGPSVALLYMKHCGELDCGFDEALQKFAVHPRNAIYNFVKNAWSIV